MLQSLPHQVVPSPARLGLSNPNSPALQSPSATKSSSQPTQSNQSHQQVVLPTPKTTSSTLLSLLPPLQRAQALLVQMAALAAKLFEVSPNRSVWVNSFRSSLPTFLPSQTHSTTTPPIDASTSTTKEIIALFTSLQTQLFEAVAELQEILDLQDAKQKLNQEIEAKDSAILSFAKKLKEAERVLDILVDDYADYRRPKRLKSEDSDSSSSNTTVASQLKLSDVISYAHKISYTTFAPPEFGAGGPLRGALPPAPQEDQMRASQLYAFVDLDVGLPKTVEDEKKIEPLIETPALPPADPMAAIKGLMPPNITVPAGWKPGMPVELPTDIPLPPAGWKPGDPINLPPLESLPMAARAGQQPPLPAAPPVFPRAPEPIQVPHIRIDILDQDDDSDEYTSDEGSSDDED
ncbi:mediator of RNA polymerase II transcription subunit 4-like [Chenopodium quinoa]|uniref:Mediator of RNA polymerase II transcription subunit 4 n=1 Tax=Chenopodium quinoa TaxID=63459 RepID=A0A803M8Y5_CHEQI|nr:mediator of RNA polymerase II transcription subunit 4-like [Chenopodium quinoa]